MKYAIIFAVFVATISINAEDLRLAQDGKSIEAVNTITNIASRVQLEAAEAKVLQDISQAKQTVQQANAVIAQGEAQLTDIRRYLATLDAMIKMKRDGTNVVNVPITLPPATNAPVKMTTNGVDVPSTNAPPPKP